MGVGTVHRSRSHSTYGEKTMPTDEQKSRYEQLRRIVTGIQKMKQAKAQQSAAPPDGNPPAACSTHDPAELMDEATAIALVDQWREFFERKWAAEVQSLEAYLLGLKRLRGLSLAQKDRLQQTSLVDEIKQAWDHARPTNWDWILRLFLHKVLAPKEQVVPRWVPVVRELIDGGRRSGEGFRVKLAKLVAYDARRDDLWKQIARESGRLVQE